MVLASPISGLIPLPLPVIVDIRGKLEDIVPLRSAPGSTWWVYYSRYIITLTLREAQSGGELWTAPDLRKPGDENIDSLQKLLLDSRALLAESRSVGFFPCHSPDLFNECILSLCTSALRLNVRVHLCITTKEYKTRALRVQVHSSLTRDSLRTPP